MTNPATDNPIRHYFGDFSPLKTRADDADGDTTRRTYTAAISSTTPQTFRGYDYMRRRDVVISETLLHAPENVDLSRLNNGANVLFNHKRDDYIGSVKTAWVDGTKAWAEFQFGVSDSAREKQADVDNETLRQVSIGYRPLEHEMRESEMDNGDLLIEYIVTRWEILEFSIVTIPADATVGIEMRQRGFDSYTKSLEKKTTNPPKEKGDAMKPENTLPNETPKAPSQITEKEINDRAEELANRKIATENERRDAIEATANLTRGIPVDELRELVSQARSDVNISVLSFAATLSARVREISAADKQARQTLGLSEGEVQQFGFGRLLRNLDDDVYDTYEMEVCAAAAQKQRGGNGIIHRQVKGGQTRSVIVPAECLPRVYSRRDNTTGNTGDLVGTEHRGSAWIDVLRDTARVVEAGVTIINLSRDKLEIPRKTNSAVFAAIAEDAAGAVTTITADKLEFEPHTAGAVVSLSRRLIMQADPSTDSLLMSDFSVGAGLWIDHVVINGAGGTEPTGILNKAGIPSITWPATGIEFENVLAFLTALSNKNALMGRLGFLMNPTLYAELQAKAKDAGSGIFLIGEAGTLQGYPVYQKTTDIGSKIIFGNWSESLLAVYESLEISRDTATRADKGGVDLRAWIDLDHGIRHDDSFVIGSSL